MTLQASLAFTVEMIGDKIKHPHTIKIESSNPATISTAQLTSIIKIPKPFNKSHGGNLGVMCAKSFLPRKKIRQHLDPMGCNALESPCHQGIWLITKIKKMEIPSEYLAHTV